MLRNRRIQGQVRDSFDVVQEEFAQYNSSSGSQAIHDASTAPAEETDSEKFFSARVDIKNFIKFLNAHHVATTTIGCRSITEYCCGTHLLPGICQDHCLILYVYIGEVDSAGGVLTVSLPLQIRFSASKLIWSVLHSCQSPGRLSVAATEW